MEPGLKRQKFPDVAAEILERMSEGFYVVDASWRLQYVNRAAETFWHRDRSELLGHSMLDLFTAFAGSPAHAAHVEAFKSGSHVQVDTVSTATGLPVSLSIYPDGDGLVVFFEDISRKADLERRLTERDDLLTLAETSAGIGVWDCDLTTNLVRGTPQYFRLHALEPSHDPVPLDMVPIHREPADRARVAEAFAEAINGDAEKFEAEFRVIRPDGDVCWVFGRCRIFRDSGGRAVRVSGVDIDITARKRQDEQLRLMTHELRHRANNLLAVVQAVARQTLRASADLKDFEVRFDGRVHALASSNELLVSQNWQGVPLGQLIRRQLQPFVESDGKRLKEDGPAVELAPKAVQTLGLALHELATNASKYGAFSVTDGVIDLSWRLTDPGPGAMFHLQWRESGGPPVKQPTRSGFGRFVVETMVAQALEGNVEIRFEPEGISWTVTCPAAAILVEGADTSGPI